MRDRSTFPVLVCTDGSPQARAAVDTAAGFPWPPRATLVVVVVRRGIVPALDNGISRDLERVSSAIAEQALSALRRRWPNAVATFPTSGPVDGILAEVRAWGARAIVVGSRGLGAVKRLLLGSVSRSIVRVASCPVLVAKTRVQEARRFLLGVDGSRASGRAVAFLASLPPPAGGHVTVVHGVEPGRVPSMGLIPASIRARLTAEARKVEAERLRAGQRLVDGAARRLRDAGWTVGPILVTGVPLERLLDTAAKERADVMVVGARGLGGVERVLLGSVAEGVLAASIPAVLIVR
jgi:nucleotide-binding universal stress UspA family protein